MTEHETVVLRSLLADDKAIAVGVMYPGENTPSGIPLIRVADIIDGRVSSKVGYRISEEVNSQYRRTQLSGQEVLMTLVGRPGIAIKVPQNISGWNTARALAVLRLADPADRDFFVYSVASPQVQHTLRNWCNTTVQATLNLKEIKALPLPWPASPTRRAIAATLGALDDKIELNRRMNETLEAMARALFRDWFVDFGPTRAKMAGTTPYLSPDLWSLFPDRLDDAGKPEGWAIHELGSVTKLQNGYAFKSKDWSDSGIPVVKIGSVKPRFVDIDQVSYVNDDLAADKSNFRLSVGDMLVGLTGYVGETGRVPPTDIPPMLNQRVGRFLPEDGLEAFVFTAVRQPDFKAYAEAKAHGSAQANVSTKDLLTFPITTPDDIALKAFCELISPLFQRSLENTGENSTLAQTRDLLLPRLMSGELRVAGAEYAVEAVL